MKKIVLVLLSLIFLIGWSSSVQAAPNIFGTDESGKTLTESVAGGAGYNTAVNQYTLAETVGRIIQIVLSIVGVLFFALMVYAGYLWMMARGDEGEVEKARAIIKMAIIGLVITLSAYTASFFIVRMIGGATGGQNRVGNSTPPGQQGQPGPGQTGGSTCQDGIKNDFETDKDCGGGTCPACDDNKACTNDLDCKSGDCFEGVCIRKPGGDCNDGVKNGDETDTDCGGPLCPVCGAGRKCKINSDCVSGNSCNSGICGGGPTCFDRKQNGNETDEDCGGDSFNGAEKCPRCDNGDKCQKNADCFSGNCDSGTKRCK